MEASAQEAEVFEIKLLQSLEVQHRLKSLNCTVLPIWDFKSRYVRGWIGAFLNEVFEKTWAKLDSRNGLESRITLVALGFVMTPVSSADSQL